VVSLGILGADVLLLGPGVFATTNSELAVTARLLLAANM
jgi:hypothetical protein